jgi:hypothetical protein
VFGFGLLDELMSFFNALHAVFFSSGGVYDGHGLGGLYYCFLTFFSSGILRLFRKHTGLEVVAGI